MVLRLSAALSDALAESNDARLASVDHLVDHFHGGIAWLVRFIKSTGTLGSND